jgi:hypothetical protein
MRGDLCKFDRLDAAVNAAGDSQRPGVHGLRRRGCLPCAAAIRCLPRRRGEISDCRGYRAGGPLKNALLVPAWVGKNDDVGRNGRVPNPRPEPHSRLAHTMSLLSGGAKVACCVGGARVAAAIITVVEVPCLEWLDQLATAAAGDFPGGDEWRKLAASGYVRAGVAAGVPAWLAFHLCRTHACLWTRIAPVAESRRGGIRPSWTAR